MFCLTGHFWGNSPGQTKLTPKSALLGIVGAQIFTGWMPFLSIKQWHQSTEDIQLKSQCCTYENMPYKRAASFGYDKVLR